MRKILITGAGGRIGAKLVERLLTVPEIQLLIPSRTEFDLLNYDEVEHFLVKEQPEIIIHLAAIVGNNLSKAEEQISYRVNVEATEKLARLAAENGTQRFIFASTAAVYNSSHQALSEDEIRLSPASSYGKEKLRAETCLQKTAEETKMKVISLRIFNVYGPGFSNSLINKLIKSGGPEKETVEIIDPENFIRDYIHIKDVIDAIEIVIDLKIPGQEYLVLNIASGIARSTSHLIDELRGLGIQPNFRLNPKPANSSFYADITKAKSILNFKPSNTLKVSFTD